MSDCTLYMQRERERERKRGMEQRYCTICVLCQLYVSSACVYSQNQNIRCICREREREKGKRGREQRDCTISVLCQVYVSSACVYSQNQNVTCMIIPILYYTCMTIQLLWNT